METRETMLPPWIVHPHAPESSAAEEYLRAWEKWLGQLSKADSLEYTKRFPMPFTWLTTPAGSGTDIIREAYASGIRASECCTKQKYTREKLQAAWLAGERGTMHYFWGHHPAKDGRLTSSCFSQWWTADFWYEGEKYCCMEQVMMAGKARLFRDEEVRQKIMQSTDPAIIKKLGRQVKGFDQETWNRHKFSLILRGNYCKFTSDPDLRAYLLGTGDEILVEASPYDTIWGIGLAANNEQAADPSQWRGENLLGFALMQVRDEIRKVFDNAVSCM